MTLKEALEIREDKKLVTYRRLAELWVDNDDPNHGSQLMGMDLCLQAFKLIYPDLEPHKIEFGQDSEFDKINKSHHGDFYWWE